MKEETKRWGIDRRIGVGTGINLIQLITFVWLGAAFYTQVSANQLRNEERFSAFAEQRKIQNEQMTKLQEAQNQLLIQSAATNVKMETQTEALKDIKDLLRPHR